MNAIAARELAQLLAGAALVCLLAVGAWAGQPPVAEAGPDQQLVDLDQDGSQVVTLDGAGSYDLDGTITSYIWREGTAQIAAGAVAPVPFAVGTHLLTLEVIDNEANTGLDFVTVTVTASSAATLSYVYGAENTTYHYRPLYVTASQGGADIWKMTLWVPEAGYSYTSHNYWDPGQIAGFKDSQHDGTGSSFEYSPEAASATANGLMCFASLGDYTAYTDSPQTAYYEFVKTGQVHLGSAIDPTNVAQTTLTVRIHAPTVGGGQFRSLLEASLTLTNHQAGSLDTWYAGGCAGDCRLSVAHGGLAGWSIVNPSTATAKPNVHNTDTTDGHQLYTLYDWYGSEATSAICGALAKAVVKNNSDTLSRNMRPGLTFEVRADDMDFYYCVPAGTMFGSTTTGAYGVDCVVQQPGAFGSGVFLDPGQSITMQYVGLISTAPTYLPPVADAGPDQNVRDTDNSGSETVTLDGSASFDPDGAVISYVWMEGASQVATGPTAQVTLAVGTHTLTLQVADSQGLTDSDTVVVQITTSRYFVDQGHPLASDANPGSEALPWMTIGRAASSALAGDLVTVKQGIYRESVAIAHSGAADHPIVFRAYPGHRVVVAGSDELVGWAALPQGESRGNPNYDHIYYLDLNWRPYALFEDEKRMEFARQPNAGTWLVKTGSTRGTVVDPVHLTQSDPNYYVGATVFYRIWSPGADYEKKITAYDPVTHTLTLESEIEFDPVVDRDYYWVFNKLELLDEPGEWAIEDRGGGTYRAYVWPSDGGSPAGHMYEGTRQTDSVFSWGNRGYITIDGFEVRHSAGNGWGLGSRAEGSTDITVQNCVITGNDYIGISVSGCTRLIIRNCISALNGYGMAIGSNSQDILVRKCEIYRNGVDGLVVSYNTSNVYVENCYIHHHYMWGHPDNMQTHNGVTNMEVRDTVLLLAGQCFMISETTGLHFINCIVAGSAAPMFNGSATDQTLTDCTCAYSSLLMLVLTQTDYTFKNNIFYRGYPTIFYGADASSNLLADYNIYWHGPGAAARVAAWGSSWYYFSGWKTASGQDTNSNYVDPQFINGPAWMDGMEGCAVPSYTTSRIYMDGPNDRFAEGDHIEIDFDGVVRTITGRGYSDSGEWPHDNYLDFTPPLDKPLVNAGVVCNWLTKTNYDLDLRPAPGSWAIGHGENGSDIGSSINLAQYRAGDFDGDGQRDIPVWPAVPGVLAISAAVDWNWVYQNTQATTADRHHSVLVVTLDQEAAPGETYAVEFTEDDGPLANFTIQTVGPNQYNILGGRIDASTPNPGASGSYNIGVKYAGQASGKVATATVGQRLRPLGDIDGDGDIDAGDKAQMNRRLNSLSVSHPDRAFNLTGDLDPFGNPNIDANDKAVMNRLLNSLPIQ